MTEKIKLNVYADLVRIAEFGLDQGLDSIIKINLHEIPFCFSVFHKLKLDDLTLNYDTNTVDLMRVSNSGTASLEKYLITLQTLDIIKLQGYSKIYNVGNICIYECDFVLTNFGKQIVALVVEELKL